VRRHAAALQNPAKARPHNRFAGLKTGRYKVLPRLTRPSNQSSP
jgi:hypothetical protein